MRKLQQKGDQVVTLPSFIIGGAEKGGTTSMWAVFRKHPEIFMSPVKEVCFFHHDHLYAKGLSWYASHFQGCNGKTVVGEATPLYIANEHSSERIARALPNVKLIFSLRNPIDRAYSQYWDGRRGLREHRPFEEVIELDTRTYVSKGHYYQQLMRYLQYFPRENVLILLYDDLMADPLAFYKRCFQFLGVDDSFVCPEMDQKFNESSIPANPLYMLFLRHPHLLSYLPRVRGRGLATRLLLSGKKVYYRYPPMDPEVRSKLVDVFSEPNRQLADFLGRDLSRWNN